MDNSEPPIAEAVLSKADQELTKEVKRLYEKGWRIKYLNMAFCGGHLFKTVLIRKSTAWNILHQRPFDFPVSLSGKIIDLPPPPKLSF